MTSDNEQYRLLEGKQCPKCQDLLCTDGIEVWCYNDDCNYINDYESIKEGKIMLDDIKEEPCNQVCDNCSYLLEDEDECRCALSDELIEDKTDYTCDEYEFVNDYMGIDIDWKDEPIDYDEDCEDINLED